MLKSSSIVMRKTFSSRCFKRLCSSKSDNESIIVEKFDEITTIGINRPEKRNCLDSSSGKLLAQALNNFEKDDTSRVGIIYGLGGNFCAGRDLEEVNNLDLEKFLQNENGSTMGIPIKLINKPLVAAISGYAVAEGFELALMCDLRVIEDNSILGMYNRRFGMPCMNGGTVHLSAIVGLSRALDLILTGRSLKADDAFHWGLANRIVACGTALGQAIQLAGSLVKFPQNCMLQDRKALYESAYNFSYEKLIQFEKENAIKVLNQESIDGAKKFIEMGIGRNGKTYHLKEKKLPDWEK